MLSLLMDIKNNRVRGGAARCVVLSTGTISWLRSVEAPAAALQGLSWPKLLSPAKKVRPCGCPHPLRTTNRSLSDQVVDIRADQIIKFGLH